MREMQVKQAEEKIKEIREKAQTEPGPECQRELIVKACDSLLGKELFGVWLTCESPGELLQAAVSYHQGASFEKAIQEAKAHPAKI